MGTGFRNQHELIIHLTKGQGNFYSASFANVLKCGRTYQKKERIHPTEKPVKILHDLLQVVTKEGDTVLDPFFGSGSLGEACLKSNRNFIGIEKNGLYHANATERIKQCQTDMKTSIFNGA
jgi:site-specific DNA-methyltransferase (adenine-specific)